MCRKFRGLGPPPRTVGHIEDRHNTIASLRYLDFDVDEDLQLQPLTLKDRLWASVMTKHRYKRTERPTYNTNDPHINGKKMFSNTAVNG